MNKVKVSSTILPWLGSFELFLMPVIFILGLQNGVDQEGPDGLVQVTRHLRVPREGWMVYVLEVHDVG